MFLEKKTKTEIISIPFLCAAGTDVGRQRDENEDSFVFDAEHGFFLVVDGMGGHDQGKVAAKIAAETIQTGIRKIENSAAIRIRDSIVLANNAVLEYAVKNSLQMGCVLTTLLIEKSYATIGHVGDTRLYKIRHGNINKLTTDHSFVGKLEEAGDLSEKRLMEHPRRNEVTRCVGIEEKSFEDEDFVDFFQTNFECDAAFLLCSDGLSDLLTATQILEIIECNCKDPQEIVTKLIEQANNLGGKDNITVIFIGGMDFPGEVGQRRDKTMISKTQKVLLVFFNRWSLFIYGILLGAALTFIYYRLSLAE